MTTIYMFDDVSSGGKSYFSSREEAVDAAECFYDCGDETTREIYSYQVEATVSFDTMEEFVDEFIELCDIFDLDYVEKDDDDNEEAYSDSCDERIITYFVHQDYDFENIFKKEVYTELSERINRSPKIMKAVREKVINRAIDRNVLPQEAQKLLEICSDKYLIDAAISGNNWRWWENLERSNLSTS